MTYFCSIELAKGFWIFFNTSLNFPGYASCFSVINPLNPNIKIKILIYRPFTFSVIEVLGELVEVSVRLIFPSDHVLNSQDRSVF